MSFHAIFDLPLANAQSWRFFVICQPTQFQTGCLFVKNDYDYYKYVYATV